MPDFGYFVDIGFERKGFLPLEEVKEPLRLGDAVTVYVKSAVA